MHKDHKRLQPFGDMSGLNQIRHARQNILHHLRRDIHTRGRDAIAKLHRVIDLVDGQAILRFKQIERQQAAMRDVRDSIFSTNDKEHKLNP